MKRIVLLIMVGVLLAACSGGTSFSSSCNNATDERTSVCDINFATLTGAYSKDVEVEYVMEPGQTEMPLYLEMSIATGGVSVSYTDSSGQTVTQSGTQGTPLVIQDTARINGDVIRLTFNSETGTATGVNIDLAAGANAWR